jgi:RNA polymerase sigma-70 factor, ECF subfamily
MKAMADSEVPILIKKAQERDREAFDALIAELRLLLEKHVRLRIGKHLEARVELADVLQETYAQAWKSVVRFRFAGSGSFFRWLKAISENVILKLAARARRDQVFYVEKDSPDPAVSQSRALRREERFDRLEEALKTLDPDYRRAIQLVRIDGLPVKEAARRMDRTPKAVMHLLERALKKLKSAFGDTESLRLPDRRLKDAEAGDGD